ncbi:hypothetical protein QBC33DRAFT_520042 [Phialemonium atrogriseum]|uniref:Uncharacterized protein n=1 Tax=Phialemonium atrogriseum TaxID=1093897 RepID=A0AAJ0BRM9_9PEZI|nr:uncharacterized protein QBC33DRAFT_520042 [Phialemonium atrogriseum]KAK1761869.1 hypothetical protein QBC33DRAFT_520042 [Phialemonium atrogriseum]
MPALKPSASDEVTAANLPKVSQESSFNELPYPVACLRDLSSINSLGQIKYQELRSWRKTVCLMPRLAMANLKLHVVWGRGGSGAGADDTDGAVNKLRASVARVVDDRLGEGYVPAPTPSTRILDGHRQPLPQCDLGHGPRNLDNSLTVRPLPHPRVGVCLRSGPSCTPSLRDDPLGGIRKHREHDPNLVSRNFPFLLWN